MNINKKNKILLVASYDSFLKSGYTVAKQIEQCQLDIYIHKSKENILSKNQILEFGISLDQIHFFHLDDYFHKEMYLHYKYVILSVGNGPLKRFFLKQQSLEKQKIQTPIIITLFPGVIFGDQNSILARMASDIILYNNKYDYQVGLEISKVYGFNSKQHLFGFQRESLVENSLVKKDKIYFIDQVKIPQLREERLFLLQQLILLAEKYPDKNFVILPRVHGNDITVHANQYPYEKLAEKLILPKNLEIVRKSLLLAFQEMAYCLSISSTVLFEALINDIPVGVINDLGIKEEYQNKYFYNSGLLINLDTIDFSENKIPNQEWLDLFLTNSCDNIGKFNSFLKNFTKSVPNYENYFSLLETHSSVSASERFFKKVRKLINDPKAFFLDSKFFKFLNNN